MRWAFSTLVLVGAISACTTAEQYRRPDGGNNFVIACGAAVGWNICIDRANEECQTGFDVLWKHNDFNRKEMLIACAAQHSVSPAARVAAACRLRMAEMPGPLSESERQSRVRDCVLAAGYLPDER